MTTPDGRRGPPSFAVQIIDRALRDEPPYGIDATIARLIAATLQADDRPALNEFARTGRWRAPELQDELRAIRRTFRPAWLAALRRFAATHGNDQPPHQPT